MGNIFEDVTDLFPTYFTKIANKNTKKQIKMKTKHKLKKNNKINKIIFKFLDKIENITKIDYLYFI